MNNVKALEKTTHYVECQSRLPVEKGGRVVVRPFVTISRQAGAGGITVSEKLAQYLNEHDSKLCPWTVFDQNLIEKVREEHNLPERFAPYMGEDKINEIDDTLEELFGLHPAKWALVHRTTETILHLGQMGRCILVGRGAHVVTAKFPGGFHVRLIGSLEKRVRHIQEYYDFNRKEAAEFIKKEDRDRAGYVKKYFDRKIDDPLLYHLVINTDLVSYEDAAKIISAAVLKNF